jgi:hypothetical protein
MCVDAAGEVEAAVGWCGDVKGQIYPSHRVCCDLTRIRPPA